MLIRICSPYFVAGVVIGERAAPILRYMRYWPLKEIVAYCAKKRWQWELL